MNKPLLMSALLFVSAGCAGSSGGGKVSPEAVAESALNAMTKGDTEAIAALFPTESVISELFDCSNEAALAKLFENVNEEKENASKEFKDGAPAGFTVKYTGFETKASDTILAGKEDDGCKLKTDITTIRGKVQFEVTKDDKTKSETQGIEIVKIGEKHYLVEL